MKSQPTEIAQGTIQRIEAHLEKVEGLIEQFLTGIDLTELTMNQRLTLVMRLLALSQRAIALRQTNLMGDPENKEATTIDQFMAFMRGESSQDAALTMEPSQDLEES